MKAGVLFLSVLVTAWPSLVDGQTAQGASPPTVEAHIATPAKTAYIVRFFAVDQDTSPGTEYPSAPGPLLIIYSDGTLVEIPKERGRFGDPDEPLTQESFSDIQLADDRRHLGWGADYRICGQSYACTPELVIYQSGHKLRYIAPLRGVIFGWRFVKGGKQVVVQSGFPHGDDGGYALHDTDTGRQLATFDPTSQKMAPRWVSEFELTKK